MKLNAPSYDAADDVLGTTERKRSRPASLEYKPTDRMSVNPKPKTRGRKHHHPIEQRQDEQLRMFTPPTRARESTGIPPSRYGDLDGLDEEQLIQALYDDPDLAQGDSNPNELSEYPDHLREMMDEGIPFVQWIIVLALLGAGLYQLRKTLVGPQEVKKVERGGRKPGTGKKTRGVAKKPKGADRAIAPVDDGVEKVVAEIEGSNNKSTTKTSAKKAAAPKKKARKPKATKEAKKETQTASQDAHDSPDTLSTDGSSTSAENAASNREEVGESDRVNQAEAAAAPIHKKDPVQKVVVEDSGEWQTVSKKAKPAADKKAAVDEDEAAETKNGKHVAGVAGKSDPKVGEKSGDEAADEPVESAAEDIQPGKTAPTGDDRNIANQSDDNGAAANNAEAQANYVQTNGDSGHQEKMAESTSKKKRKKKKKANNDAATDAANSSNDEAVNGALPGNGGDLDDDEALALQLQLEEENLVLADKKAEEEQKKAEEWGLVTKRKKKKVPS